MPGRRRSEISDLSARSCNSRHGFRAHSGSACGSLASSRTARCRTSIGEVLRDAGEAPFGAAATSSTLASLPRGPPPASKRTPRAAPLCAHDGAPRRRCDPRAPGCREGRDADARRPAPEHAERSCGAPRHVERPSPDEGTAVVDPHDNRPAIGEVRHPYPGAERQRGMSRREGVGREALAARGPVAL